MSTKIGVYPGKKLRRSWSRTLETDNMRKHCLAAEAIMRSLAPRFGSDPEMWGLTGLLHDIDYNETRDNMPQHTLLAEKILLEKGVVGQLLRRSSTTMLRTSDYPQRAHSLCSHSGRDNNRDAGCRQPGHSKKLSAVTVKSVKKRMKAKEFARSVNRDHIRLCEEIGVPLDEFIDLSLEAMNGISDELGL